MNNLNTKYDEIIKRQGLLEVQVNGIKEPAPVFALENYRKAFNKFLLGETIKDALKEGSDGSGGYLVPNEFENQIISCLEEENVLRKISNVITTSHDLKIPGVVNNGSATWISEGEKIEESDDAFGQIVIRAYKIGTSIKVSDELIEDSAFDIEKYISETFAHRIGKTEEDGFLNGTGIGQPKGLLLDATVGTLTETSGKITLDDVINLFHSVGGRYRASGILLMNSKTFRLLYKEKGAFGQNIWEPSLEKDVPTKLLGKPVIICDSMPDPESFSKPVLFGDFSYYWIGDRGNRSIKRLNELYAKNGQVGFLTSQRVDAKLTQPEAIKSLQVR